MKRLVKRNGLTLVVALAFSGIAAAPSFASEFHWGDTGEAVEGETPFESSLASESEGATLTWTVFGTTVNFIAQAATISGSHDNSANGGTTGQVTGARFRFTGVQVTPMTACKIHSPGAPAGTIEWEALTGEAVEEPLGVELTPEVSETFVSLAFEGAGCVLAGMNLNFTGVLKGNAYGDEVEFNSESGSELFIGGTELGFDASFTTEAMGRPITVE